MAEAPQRSCYICGRTRPELFALPHQGSLVEACAHCFLAVEIRDLAARLPDTHPALDISAEGLETIYRILRTAVVEQEASVAP